jgi:glucose-1-phosphate adenylyltransferase
VIPDGMVIGENPEDDARRFRRTAGGVTLVTREMLERLA